RAGHRQRAGNAQPDPPRQRQQRDATMTTTTKVKKSKSQKVERATAANGRQHVRRSANVSTAFVIRISSFFRPWVPRHSSLAFRSPAHSHSIVAGGLELMS
ncbi:MAG: hypothetical protein MUE50_16180, partial [Pirellulaceae bacterium]|nr:hypothetical protein [Pirellulaceae bacterium]